MMALTEAVAPMTPELLAALEARGFDAEAFLKLDLGVGESRQQAGALAILFYDGHNVVGVKVRAIGQAKQFGAGGIFYNLNCLNAPELANEPLIVAEGGPNVPLSSQNILGMMSNPPSLDAMLRAMRRPGLF